MQIKNNGDTKKQSSFVARKFKNYLRFEAKNFQCNETMNSIYAFVKSGKILSPRLSQMGSRARKFTMNDFSERAERVKRNVAPCVYKIHDEIE